MQNTLNSNQNLTFTILEKKYGVVLTYSDLAEIFKKHTKTIQRYIKDGVFPFGHVGKSRYFKLVDVVAFIDGGTTTTQQKQKTNAKKGRKAGSKNLPKALKVKPNFVDSIEQAQLELIVN